MIILQNFEKLYTCKQTKYILSVKKMVIIISQQCFTDYNITSFSSVIIDNILMIEYKTEFPSNLCISSVESQKGIIAIQRCSVENQKGAIAVQSAW